MRLSLIFIILIIAFFSCYSDEQVITELDSTFIIQQLYQSYDPMPEEEISNSIDGTVYATYTDPTDIYAHGILGDRIEGTRLVVVVDGIFYDLKLESEYVYEDIRPRLYDVDNDGKLEFITIRTSVEKGAAIVIYKLRNNQLSEYAIVPEVGIYNRWVNPVAIGDLDNDGTVDIAWIQTPHIGGILKVARIEEGIIEVIAETSLYSNHGIGERNLCLSVLTENSNEKVFYVPNQERTKIIGFSFKNEELEMIEEITQEVDFSKTLRSQYTFSNIIEGEDNCIIVE